MALLWRKAAEHHGQAPASGRALLAPAGTYADAQLDDLAAHTCAAVDSGRWFAAVQPGDGGVGATAAALLADILASLARLHAGAVPGGHHWERYVQRDSKGDARPLRPTALGLAHAAMTQPPQDLSRSLVWAGVLTVHDASWSTLTSMLRSYQTLDRMGSQ
jgi:hypothetical protein